MSEYLPPVVLKLTGDDDNLLRTLRSAKEHIKTWAAEVGKTKAELKVTVDDTQAQQRLRSVQDRIRNLRDTSVTVTIDDSRGAQTLRDIKASLNRIDTRSVTARVSIDDSQAQSRLRSIADRLRNLSGVSLTVTLDDTVAAQQLRNINANLTRIDGRSVSARVGIDDTMAQARLNSVRDRLRALRNAKVKVEVDVTEALLNLSLVEAALARIERLNARVRLNARLSGGGGGGGAGGSRGSGPDDIGLRLRAALLSAMRNLPAFQVTADTSAADREVAALRERLRLLGSARIGIDISVEEAMRRTELIRAQLLSITNHHVDVRVRASAAQAIITLDRIQAQVNHLNGQQVDINTRPAIKSFGALATSILAVGPAAVPVLAGVTAAVLGVASAWGTAAVSAGAFGLALKPQLDTVQETSTLYATIGKRTDNLERAKELLGKFTEGSKEHTTVTKKITAATVSLADAELKYQRALDDLTPTQRAAAEGFGKVKLAYDRWSDSLSPTTLGVFSRIMDGLTGVFPKLTPLVEDAGKAIHGFIDGIGDGPGDAAFRKFYDMVKTQGGDSLLSFLNTAKNVIAGVTGILNAFDPGEFSQGLEGLSERFARWGDRLGASSSFQKFMDYAREQGPKVVEFIEKLSGATGRLLDGLSGPGGLALTVLSGVLDVISKIPVPVLEQIAISLPLIALGVKAWATAQWLLNVAMDANPLGIILGALGLLASAFYVAWTHSQKFREIATMAFTGLTTTVLVNVRLLLEMINAFSQDLIVKVEDIVIVLAKIPGPTQDSMRSAAQAIRDFRKSADDSFGAATHKLDEWTATVADMPRIVKIQGNIDDLTSKVTEAKRQLQDENLPSYKKTTLNADIADWETKIATAKASIESTPEKKRAVLTTQIDEWMQRIDAAKASLATVPPEKKTVIQANIDDLQLRAAQAIRDLNRIEDRTVSVSVSYSYHGPRINPGMIFNEPYANGGIVPRFANGGVLHAANGLTVPGYAPRRDIVPALLSPGEGVLIPEAVRQIGGARTIDSLNRAARSGPAASGSALLGIAASRPAPATGQVNVFHITVQGSVLSEQDLRMVLERQMYQLGMNSPQTWTPYARQ